MTQSLRRTVTLTMAAFVLAAMAMLSIASASAQSPPNPPSRFVGSVLVNGAAATAGTAIEARIAGATCGATTVFMASGQARYVLDSPALEPANNVNCGVDGSVVTFFVGGVQAAETGIWRNYQLNTVNLSVMPATTATPTATTPAGTTPTTAAAPSRTPGAPAAGNTGAMGGDTNVLAGTLAVAAVLGLAGVGGLTLARRRG